MSSFSIKLSIENFANDIIGKVKNNLPNAKKATLRKIAKDTDEFVPYKTGALSKNVYVDDKNSTITYATEYASYAFDPIAPSGIPKQYTKTVHQNAQGFPFEKSVDEHGAEWVDYFRKELMNGVSESK